MVEGISRVTEIVRAMREFAHPGSGERAAVDLNEAPARHARRRALAATRTSPTSRPDFGDVPAIVGDGGELNQVFLNLIVNAAHAIAEANAAAQRGRIRVRTHAAGEHAVVADQRHRHRHPGGASASAIFDPFFTTKAVGEGTGQGLAIARSIVSPSATAARSRCDSEPGSRHDVHRPPAARL